MAQWMRLAVKLVNFNGRESGKCCGKNVSLVVENRLN